MRIRILLGLVVLIVLVAAALYAFTGRTAASPAQPIAYTHKTHADNLAINCNFCHRNATTGYIADLPPVELCMGCHRNIPGSGDKANEIKKVADAYANQTPIDWVRVVYVPDFVKFSHRPHVRTAGIVCQTCHVREPSGDNWAAFAPGMAWCTTCHTQKGASTDCWTCHR